MQYNAEKPGDLLFIIALQPHPTFRLLPSSGYDLECDATLTLSEMLLGFDRVVTIHLDGRYLQVKHTQPIEPGSNCRILLKGEGLLMKRPSLSTRTSSDYSSKSNGSKGASADHNGRGSKRGDLWICIRPEDNLAQWVDSLEPVQREQLAKLLPPKRPPLEVEDEELVLCPDAKVLTVRLPFLGFPFFLMFFCLSNSLDFVQPEEAERIQEEQRPRPSSGSSSRSYSRGPDGYQPNASPDLDCKPS